MNIGETIKKLRREREMTQEQLAEFLNITTQAVSKWETGLSLPDITLIPMLANIFGTSADVLLGVDVSAKDKRINEILVKAEKILYSGYHSKATAIYREGLKEFPDSYKIMSGLMSSVWKERDGHEEKRGEMTKEVIRLGEKILEGCTDDKIRHNAIQLLCYTYPEPEVGQIEKAVALAEKMPETILSRQNLLASIYRGDRRFSQKRSNIISAIDHLGLDMTCNNIPLDDGSEPYTDEEMILIREKSLAMLEIFIEDGNYGFFRQKIAWTNIDIAKSRARLGDFEGAIENLKTAAGHAIINDTEYAPDKKYTCLIFRGMEFGEVLHNIAENDTLHQLDEMKDKVFDPIRERTEFAAIEEILLKYAGKR